ncbi:MAG TPA: translation elongation factor EF-1 subunit alpha [archaeon]|nr:translation elongation factor EF-1 subunit alpha [archaeon]
MAEKPHLNVVFVGHVDHGKSTTVGRLLYDTGHVPENVMRKLKEEADKGGKATWEFAFVMDRLKEERERGLTIDIAHHEFKTNKHYITVIDAPGHKDFVKNMITGASQADAAVLMVSGKEGPQAQTKEHITLVKTAGINQLAVCVNKMDEINYDEKRFNEVKADLEKDLKMMGFDLTKIAFIPTSGYKGDNICKKSENMAWYKGPTLLDAIDNFEPPNTDTLAALPLRLPIQDSYSISGIGLVPVGRVETGVLKVNSKVSFMPSNVGGEVKSIEMHHQQLQEARPGDNVGFNVRGVGKGDIRRGDVAGPADNPPTVVESFTAQLVVLNHPTVIAVGYAPVFHMHTSQVACRITKLLKKLDPKSGQVAAENPDFIKTGDAAIVELTPNQPMCAEKYKDIPPLGRFSMRDMGMTVGVGMIIDLKEKVM